MQHTMKYSVLLFGSHPDLDNDDCWTGADFDSREEAEQCFANLSTAFGRTVIGDSEYITLVGPWDGSDDADCFAPVKEQIRRNPDFVPSRDDGEWRREAAREAGMLHGIDAYNDFMGY